MARIYETIDESQDLWQSGFITNFGVLHRDEIATSLSSDEQRQARLDAACLLATQKRSAFLLDRLDQINQQGDLPECERQRLRTRYHNLYRQAVGVTPEFHDELRQALTDVSANGNKTVDAVLQEFRHRAYSNPLASTA